LWRRILGDAHPGDDVQAYQTGKFVIVSSAVIDLATLYGFAEGWKTRKPG